MTEQFGKLKQSRINILLVDDDEGNIVLTERALEGEEYGPKVHAVRDGVEAMWYLRRKGEFAEAPRPDLVLLDLHMPRKDGREVLAETNRKRRHVPSGEYNVEVVVGSKSVEGRKASLASRIQIQLHPLIKGF